MDITHLRVGHAEREPVIDQLNQAFAEGRLDGEERDQRVHLAMTSKTYGDLALLTRDLVLPSSSETVTGEDRMLAGLAHASGIATLFVGPLLFLLFSGKRSAYVRRHAAAAVNFQLTLLVITIVTFGIGSLLYLAAWLIALIAALSAVAQGSFAYPYTVRFLK
ncbi:DUF1707 domain-containing protein [Actinocorallia lasiicapitis]